MRHEKPKDGAPEAGVFNLSPEPAGDNFAGKFFTASQATHLTVSQALRNGVVVGRLANVMFHFARENERKIQSAEAGSAPEANVPRLLSKRIRSQREIPNRVHEAGN